MTRSLSLSLYPLADVQKLGVWIPDGDGACTNLLKFALNENNFENTLVVFVVSMSTPWSILDSLKKWANILSEHVRKLPLSEATRQKLVRRQQRIFQQYQEPDETTSATTTTPQPQQQQQHLQTPTTSGRKRSNAAMIGVDALGLGKEAGGAANDDDYMLLPLDADVLNQCLGLSMVVVVTKSDYTSVLDKEMDYRIEHFEFIQYHIRRFCLECTYKRYMIKKIKKSVIFLRSYHRCFSSFLSKSLELFKLFTETRKKTSSKKVSLILANYST